MSARLLLSMLAGASFVLGVASAATAQPYPQRPVKLIVSLVAGSPADLVARIDRRQAVGTSQADVRGGESTRRPRQPGGRVRRPGGARRAHVAFFVEHDADRQSERLQEAALRPGRRLAAPVDRGDHQHDAGGASLNSGELGHRARCAREARAHGLCAWWTRQPRPSDHGVFPPGGRLPGNSGALPRQCPIGERSRRRPDQAAVSSERVASFSTSARGA